ncbi:MAG: alkaline phosphatase family protein [Candidatus Omnitrophica bacterium]|nr:alkaline phosphatase family protein [Candidatus Omnitrophota bacterium]
MGKEKILLIGLDGLDYGLFEYLVKNNITPNLARLRENGACGRMLSSLPLQTPATWTSFITGKNAGKHGVFGFFSYKKGSYELKVLNSLERKSQTLWHILNRYGKRVGIFNMPSLFPPEPIDGYMICGMLAPSINCDFTYPRALKEKLLKAVRGYEIEIGMTMSARDSKRMLLKKSWEIKERRIEAAKFLMDQFPCDLTMIIFTGTDRIEHFFLKDMGSASGYKDAITDYFRFLDGKIEELLKRIDQDTTVIIMSDHGMAPFNKVFYVNNLLKEIGLLSEERISAGYMRQSLVERCFKLVVNFCVRIRISPESLKRFLPRWLFNRLTVILGRGGNFDWANTRAFFSSSVGDAIMINLKGRQPKGIVAPEDYEKLRDRIIDGIKALRDPDTREGIVEGVYRREEIFSGDYLDEAPDIVLKLKDGYVPHSSIEAPGIIGRENPFEPISSDHTRNAVIIMRGDRIKNGFAIEGAGILDIAPTILALMGVAAPSDFDGRVLKEAFKEWPEAAGQAPCAGAESERLRKRIEELKAGGRIK